MKHTLTATLNNTTILAITLTTLRIKERFQKNEAERKSSLRKLKPQQEIV